MPLVLDTFGNRLHSQDELFVVIHTTDVPRRVTLANVYRSIIQLNQDCDPPNHSPNPVAALPWCIVQLNQD